MSAKEEVAPALVDVAVAAVVSVVAIAVVGSASGLMRSTAPRISLPLSRRVSTQPLELLAAGKWV